jgi:hypothetical protein
MRRDRSARFLPWLVGFTMTAMAPSQTAAQAPETEPSASVVVLAPEWDDSRLWLRGVQDTADQSEANRSAARIITTHALVGTGAGLVIGLLLSSAAAADDDTSVVVTWTALGLTAGMLGGAVTWLVERGE